MLRRSLFISITCAMIAPSMGHAGPHQIFACGAAIACLASGCAQTIPKDSYDVATTYKHTTLGFGHKESLPSRFQETYKEVSPNRKSALEAKFLEQAKIVLDRLPPEILNAKQIVLLGTSIDGTQLGGHNNGNGTIQIAIEMSSYYRIAHEIGHSFQHDLTSSDKAIWDKTFAQHYKNQTGPNFRFDDTLNREIFIEEGFVSQYSYQNWKEDFAEIFASMVTGRLYKSNLNFWEVYEQSELVRIKTDLIMNVLRRTIPNLSVEHFKTLPPLIDSDTRSRN